VITTPTRSVVGNVTIDWSDTVALQLMDGRIFNAFAENTYAARVQRDDGKTVIVALPKGAARRQPEVYADAVAELAKAAGFSGQIVGVTHDLLEDMIA
jgi:hypothetical protein